MADFFTSIDQYEYHVIGPQVLQGENMEFNFKRCCDNNQNKDERLNDCKCCMKCELYCYPSYYTEQGNNDDCKKDNWNTNDTCCCRKKNPNTQCEQTTQCNCHNDCNCNQNMNNQSNTERQCCCRRRFCIFGCRC